MDHQNKFKNLSFSLYKDAHKMTMFESYYRNGKWDDGAIVPFHDISLSPAANILNYGQGIFEGMKAFKTAQGKIVMFRPQENAKRFARSCDKIAIPEVNTEKFMQAVNDLVLSNQDFIPQSDDGSHSLYLRPVCIGVEPLLGVRASEEYLFYIFASPVGPYFDKVGVVRLMVTDTHRAAAHGIGDAKAASNYAVTMNPKKQVKALGFDEALYLDTINNRYIEEAGAANFFALMPDNTLVTPKLGSILPGITRDSIIRLAKEVYGLNVEERNLDIEEVCKEAKECFLCGTGAIITSVKEISWKNTVYNINKNDFQFAHQMYNKLIGIQLQKEADPYNWVVTFN